MPKKGEKCYVHLGRFGDLMILLPGWKEEFDRTGKKPIVLVAEEFASLFDGVSYIQPWVEPLMFCADARKAKAMAEAQFEKVIFPRWWDVGAPPALRNPNKAVKVEFNGKPILVDRDTCHQSSQWYAAEFSNVGIGSWPLVFDRRDLRREADLVKMAFKTSKPKLLINFKSVSSPFGAVPEVMAALNQFRDQFEFVDIGVIKAERIYDLLGLFDRAAILLTVDTSTLHLAAASQVPCAAITKDGWRGSIPKGNCVLSVTYETVLARIREITTLVSKHRAEKIEAKPNPIPKPATLCFLLNRETKATTSTSRKVGGLFHIYTDYNPRDADTVRRNNVAKSTWTRQGWNEIPIKDSDLPRLWEEGGKKFPYIGDMFDLASKGKQPDDILIYTNSDICLASNCASSIADAMLGTDAVYCLRRDFDRLTSAIPDATITTGANYCGSDLKAFRVSWWLKNRAAFPDMLVGIEAWDSCLRILMEETNPPGKTLVRDLIYHERHRSFWEATENRYTLKAQQHALKLASTFFITRGINPKTFGIPDTFCDKVEVIILGLANESVMFPKCIANLEKTLDKVGSWRAFVCASQRAKPILSLWAKRRPRMVFEVPEPDVSGVTRYQKMARLRNSVLTAWQASGVFTGAILFCDMDVLGFHSDAKSVLGLLRRDDWDVAATTGLKRVAHLGHDVNCPRLKINNAEYAYYDWLAFESRDGERVLWSSGNPQHWYSHESPPEHIRFSRRKMSTPAGLVNSAFGPICFYRPSAFFGLAYNEATNELEHTELHARMRSLGRDRIIVEPSIITLYD